MEGIIIRGLVYGFSFLVMAIFSVRKGGKKSFLLFLCIYILVFLVCVSLSIAQLEAWPILIIIIIILLSFEAFFFGLFGILVGQMYHGYREVQKSVDEELDSK